MNPAASTASDSSAAAAQPGSNQPYPPQPQRQIPQPQQQIPQPQQQTAPPVAYAEVSPSVVEELQHCLALISSQPDVATGSMEVLHKLLSNLITAPQVSQDEPS
jgi:hypothetical protein